MTIGGLKLRGPDLDPMFELFVEADHLLLSSLAFRDLFLCLFKEIYVLVYCQNLPEDDETNNDTYPDGESFKAEGHGMVVAPD